MSERIKATFAQMRAGVADVAAIATDGPFYYLVGVTATGVYTAPLGTTLSARDAVPPAPVWVLMTDVSDADAR